jgi:hypothetical protein
MYTKIRFLGSSSKRKFVRYEIPTAQWLSNNSTERATVVKLGRKAFKLLSICSFTVDKKLSQSGFCLLTLHPFYNCGCWLQHHSFALLFSDIFFIGIEILLCKMITPLLILTSRRRASSSRPSRSSRNLRSILSQSPSSSP